MDNSLNNLTNEELLTYYLSKKLNKKEIADLKKIISSDLDWTRVLGLLQMHRLMGCAWINLRNHVIGEGGSPSFNHFSPILYLAYKAQKAQSKEQFIYISKVTKLFEENQIEYILLKGISVAAEAYLDLGLRVSNDTDILVHHKDVDKAKRLLCDMGYVQGEYNVCTKELELANRKEIITAPMVSHEIYPLTIKTEDTSIIEWHKIDLHFSVDLMTSNRTDNIVEDFLARRRKIKIESIEVYTSDVMDTLMFLCIHLYKEAINISEVRGYKDLLMFKFGDIYNLINVIDGNQDEKLDWESFIYRVKNYQLEKGIFYSLWSVNTVFGNVVPQHVLDSLQPDNLSYLNEVYDNGEVVIKWKQPLLERIFNTNRLSESVK
ncbi:hypothetical protein RW25_28470 [Bacillus sp. L_1B0_8]|uniref:nucleotidyltransferase family protein n=1 Tax=unclassified Bacillus (in: firmicutes) TaxID=185979 RepID=UPI0005B752B4|nr:MULTISPECIES: nucleotidyltransferase family protein [unclassified Bacillus (in: firmicutes)]KIQ77601.1 hypothetical protein RT27_30850 [Bacillus sp. L_1B0_5]KIQ78084.1 hypothetical protein RW25_28470 [Bacillus sp. L_1B0_8]